MATTSRSTRRRSCTERTTPVRPSRSRPTSNCGLTQQRRGRRRRARAGAARAARWSREMKLRSATTRSKAPPRAAASTSRMFVPGRSVTLGSAATLGDELPVADVEGGDVRGPVLEQHLGEAAGTRPDVEATAPLDGDGPRLRARSSLSAARPTQRSGVGSAAMAGVVVDAQARLGRRMTVDDARHRHRRAHEPARATGPDARVTSSTSSRRPSPVTRARAPPPAPRSLRLEPLRSTRCARSPASMRSANEPARAWASSRMAASTTASPVVGGGGTARTGGTSCSEPTLGRRVSVPGGRDVGDRALSAPPWTGRRTASAPPVARRTDGAHATARLASVMPVAPERRRRRSSVQPVDACAPALDVLARRPAHPDARAARPDRPDGVDGRMRPPVDVQAAPVEVCRRRTTAPRTLVSGSGRHTAQRARRATLST